MRLTSSNGNGLRRAPTPGRDLSTGELADELGLSRNHAGEIMLRLGLVDCSAASGDSCSIERRYRLEVGPNSADSAFLANLDRSKLIDIALAPVETVWAMRETP